jgi:shikimate kinase
MNRKLEFAPGIYLVGFMASGKSTIGRLLAERLGWHFADIDEDIEASEQRSIAEIFERNGEQEFRSIETEAIRTRLREIEAGEQTVVALGGGAFVEPTNFHLLADKGVSIWLDCPLEKIRLRVDRVNHRPLARDPKSFEELYYARQAAYQRADYRMEIDTDDPSVVVDAILRLPCFDV